MDAASCRTFAANAVRLQIHALAYSLGNFLRTLATLELIKDWSMTSMKEKLIKIGAKVVSHGRYIAFQVAEVAIPKNPFAEVGGEMTPFNPWAWQVLLVIGAVLVIEPSALPLPHPRPTRC